MLNLHSWKLCIPYHCLQLPYARCQFCVGASMTDLFVIFIYFDRAHDFSVEKFDDRTVMLCDQVGLAFSSCVFSSSVMFLLAKRI